MLLTRCKHSLRALALVLVCFMVITPLAGSRIFVTAGLQRGEFYASASRLRAQDVAGAAHAAHAAHAGVSKHAAGGVPARGVSTLNLFLHLSGILVPEVLMQGLARSDSDLCAGVITALPQWQLVFAIFEPPKRCRSLT